VEHEELDAEALRRRLYTPGASPADLVAYLAQAAPRESTGPEEQESLPGPTAHRRRRGLLPVGIAVVGAALVLAVGAVWTGAAGARSAAVPAPSSTPSSVGWAAAPRDPGDVMDAPSVLDGGSREHARGHAATSGDAYVYTTARGDGVTAIAGRFGLCLADVLTALPYGFDQAHVPAGQHLLLQRLLTTAQRGSGSGAC
jgi:hypothetical protein